MQTKRDSNNRICIQALSDFSFNLLIKTHPNCSKNEQASRPTTSHIIKSLITSTASLLLFFLSKKKTEMITATAIKIRPKSLHVLSSQQLFNRPEKQWQWCWFVLWYHGGKSQGVGGWEEWKRRWGGRMKGMKQSTTKKETVVGERIKGLTSRQSAIDI